MVIGGGGGFVVVVVMVIGVVVAGAECTGGSPRAVREAASEETPPLPIGRPTSGLTF